MTQQFSTVLFSYGYVSFVRNLRVDKFCRQKSCEFQVKNKKPNHHIGYHYCQQISTIQSRQTCQV